MNDSKWLRLLSDEICGKYDQCMNRFDELESEYMLSHLHCQSFWVEPTQYFLVIGL